MQVLTSANGHETVFAARAAGQVKTIAVWKREDEDEFEVKESYRLDWKTPFNKGKLLGKLVASPLAKLLKLLTPDQAGLTPAGVPL